MPELVPDLFDNEALPDSPPSIQGRLALDFRRIGATTDEPLFAVFFDSLSVTVAAAPVPEPATLALFGIALPASRSAAASALN